VVLWPIGYPLARLLDKFVGKSVGKTLNGEEMKTLFLIHSVGDNRVCTDAQVSLIHKAIDLKDNILWEIFTPIHRIVAIQGDVRLNEDVLAMIQDTGFTCLPVKNVKGAFVGVLNVKDLIFSDCGGTVKDYCTKSILWCDENMSPYSVLLKLKSKKKRIALIIQKETNIVVGLITQNDIFRYLIKNKKVIYRREVLDTNHNDESIEILSGKFSKRQTLSFEIDDLDSPIKANSKILSYLNID
jgi:metal transporter CNNM